MKEEVDVAELIIEWGFPGILTLIGILMIVFRKTLGNASYESNKSYGEIFKNEKGEPWGLFKTLVPNSIKERKREKYYKDMLIWGIFVVIMAVFLFALLRGMYH